MEYIKKLRDKTKNMPIILTGAAGAILDKNQILLVFHKKHQQWQIPGGLQEFGETLETTVEREIHEELNLNLKAGNIITVLSDFKWGWKYDNGFQIHPVTVFFEMIGEIDFRNIIIQKEEIENYGFFGLDNLPENIFPCCKEKAIILKQYLKQK